MSPTSPSEKLLPKPRPFITIIEDRSPEQKSHLNIGQAKNAVGSGWGGGRYFKEVDDAGKETGYYTSCGQVRGGSIWQQTDNEFVLIYDIEPNTPALALPWKLGDAFYDHWSELPSYQDTKRFLYKRVIV